VSDLLKDYSADAIRMTLLNHHYRYPWECFSSDLQYASELIEQFKQVRTLVGDSPAGADHLLHDRFIAAMENDLNTPAALLLLKEAVEQVIAGGERSTGAELLRLAGVLGLRI
jgi:cysteinyl-tRNA synthetase